MVEWDMVEQAIRKLPSAKRKDKQAKHWKTYKSRKTSKYWMTEFDQAINNNGMGHVATLQ